MDILIQKATQEDYSDILMLVRELATFENASECVTNTIEQMKEDEDFFTCLLAKDEHGEIMGIAVYFFAYYTWVGKSLYLDDLYVKEQYRGMGIGTQLLERLFSIAKTENCKRVRWQVLNWNNPAIEFYKKYGADIDSEWNNCDFNDIKIEKLG